MKVRTIRPEFFEREELAKSGDIMTLFIGLLFTADREGRFRWKPELLAESIFPGRDIKLEPLMWYLVKHRFISCYANAGHKYGAIHDWTIVVSIHKHEAASRLPAPEALTAFELPTNLEPYTDILRTSYGHLTDIRQTSEIIEDSATKPDIVEPPQDTPEMSVELQTSEIIEQIAFEGFETSDKEKKKEKSSTKKKDKEKYYIQGDNNNISTSTEVLSTSTNISTSTVLEDPSTISKVVRTQKPPPILDRYKNPDGQGNPRAPLEGYPNVWLSERENLAIRAEFERGGLRVQFHENAFLKLNTWFSTNPRKLAESVEHKAFLRDWPMRAGLDFQATFDKAQRAQNINQLPLTKETNLTKARRELYGNRAGSEGDNGVLGRGVSDVRVPRREAGNLDRATVSIFDIINKKVC